MEELDLAQFLNPIHCHIFSQLKSCCPTLVANSYLDAVYHHSLIESNEHPVCSPPHTSTKRLHQYCCLTLANSVHCWPNEYVESFKCNISYSKQARFHLIWLSGFCRRVWLKVASVMLLSQSPTP